MTSRFFWQIVGASIIITKVSCGAELATAKAVEIATQTDPVLLGASIIVPDDKQQLGWQPIHQVAATGTVADIKSILEQGVSSYTKTFDGYSPLHIAAQNGNLEIVDFFIFAKINVNFREYEKKTPLMLAIEHVGYSVDKSRVYELIKHLLNAGANPNHYIREDRNRNSWPSTLDMAVNSGSPQIVQALIEHGVSVNIGSGYSFPLIEAAKRAKSFEEERKTVDDTNPYYEIIKMLVKAGAKISAKDGHGHKAYHYFSGKELEPKSFLARIF